MKIYIFRHGQTIESKYNLAYSRERKLTAEILPETIPVIEKLGKFLSQVKTDANFTSPVKRCLQTVEIIKKVSGKEFEVDENIKEWMDPEESFESLVQRVSRFYEKISSSNYNSVALCSHGAILAGIKSFFENQNFPIQNLHDYPSPGVLIVLDSKTKNIEQINF
ncbi:MAG: histidine phosphatase family protein [Patescibacteria group bacterium]|nr:histidine phosphatase family protein [Patescibacteria group bacterium]